MKKLSPQYEPKRHESGVYKRWEARGAFAPSFSKASPGKPFVIMLPPPNITGSLHMGHALQDTIMDILIRFHRMRGEPTLWVPGTDHAAIATNRVLEKQLQQEGTTRQAIGRQAFEERARAWYKETGTIIVDQMKRLGVSADWSRSWFTMDPDYVQAVQTAFVEYHRRGFIYRDRRQINWCLRCQSVVSDLEIKHEQRTGTIYTLRYGPVKVATSRPETMLGDTAVAVHPQDSRYTGLIGQRVLVPLVDREIPVIADERIDRDFGTGAVKVTPAHDPLDAALAATHGLSSINVIGEDGRLTPEAGRFAGLSLADGRQAVLAALREQGGLASEEPQVHQVAVCERCGSVIEPMMSRQWFLDMSKLASQAMAAAQEERVVFWPPRWRQHFLEWLAGVHDWAVSRQIWLGQPVPAWWKPGKRGTEQEEGNYVVSIENPGQPADWQADPDVLDTWFSSALWPFAPLGWPEKTTDLKHFYPSSVLVTGRDILYLWVARMIFSGLELMGQVPFRHVFIHPTVLTKTGKRMSKSLGTGVDPLELIDKYGADATRFGLMMQMSYDQQALKFDEEAVKAARNFANKVWNLARLLETFQARNSKSETVADVWIQQRLGEVAGNVGQLLEEYKIGEVARLLYDFVWHDFADWYVEILKAEGSPNVAKRVFTDTLKLLHPFMPFMTEVLWEKFGDGKMLIVSEWVFTPHPLPLSLNKERGDSARSGVGEVERFQDIVTTIRAARRLLGIAPKEIVDVLIVGKAPLPKALAALARAKIVEQSLEEMRSFPLAAGGVVGISSAAVTPATLQAAKAALAREEGQLTDFISRQKKVVAQMRGRAEPEAVREKERLIEQSERRLKELGRSRQALG